MGGVKQYCGFIDRRQQNNEGRVL